MSHKSPKEVLEDYSYADLESILKGIHAIMKSIPYSESGSEAWDELYHATMVIRDEMTRRRNIVLLLLK